MDRKTVIIVLTLVEGSGSAGGDFKSFQIRNLYVSTFSFCFPLVPDPQS